MKHILIIEDDPRIAAALEIRFRADGYETHRAMDAVTGLSRAVQRPPDLVLLDLSLPGGDGLQLAEQFRKLPETQKTPVIFITARKDEALREQAMNLNAAGLFEKPYDPEELMAVAQYAMGETTRFIRPSTSPLPSTVTLQESASPAPAKRILIVEDDQRIAMALAVRLKAARFETHLAHDAVTGLNSAVRLRPDLILLDISMPAGNGFSVAERVQSIIPTRTPIIFLTASKQPGLRQRATDLGAVGYFEKPYEAEELVNAIQGALAA